MIKKGGYGKERESNNFVAWFSELNKDSKSIAGGKGANLAEIFNLGMPVPPGFVVTAQAYSYFLDKAGINAAIKEKLSKINYENTKLLDDTAKEIRELILKSPMPEDLAQAIIEDYGNLDADDVEMRKQGSALDLITKSPEPVFVAVRSSATAEDLAEASFAGQQDSFLNVKGNADLLLHVKKCFASLFTARATYYRNKQGFNHLEAKLAVVVQKMVNSDKSGVIFSKDPSYNNDNVVIEAVWGLGEGIVSGIISPDHYVVSSDGEMEIKERKIGTKKIALTRDSSGAKVEVKLKDELAKKQVLKDYEIKKLAEYALKLENHYGKPQDIEFAIENENIYIVQTRPVTTIGSRQESGKGVQTKDEPIVSGLAASPGIASGKVKIVYDLSDLPKVQKGDILVTGMTNPDMVVTMAKSAAIVTDEGGMTAHASIVSREMGIPCVVGTDNATEKLKDNEIVTVDGFQGKVYKGKVAEDVQKEVLPVVETKIKIKVIVDLPTFAERAAKSKVKAVGLTRLEGIIAESGKHPKYFIDNKNIKDYEEIIYKGINGIAKFFDEVWVRTSDIRTDEYANLEGAPKEIEANPMLGMHGIRYGLKHLEILKAEYKAMKRVAEKGKIIGLLHPMIISVEEIKKIKEILKEIGFTSKVRVGVMVETPAAVQVIKELCEEGIDFISFGTNDLTQFTLGLDRGNEEVQYMFDETHPAIFHQIEHVINVCKKYKVETSICGQAGSKKKMAEFLVEKGIDSITVNADMAREISEHVQKLENDKISDENEEDEIDEEIDEEIGPPPFPEELPGIVPKTKFEAEREEEIVEEEDTLQEPTINAESEFAEEIIEEPEVQEEIEEEKDGEEFLDIF